LRDYEVELRLCDGLVMLFVSDVNLGVLRMLGGVLPIQEKA